MLLFSNVSCIEENHRTIYIVLEMLKFFYILCIATKCVKSQQNYFSKKRYKRAPSIRAQKKSSEKSSCTKLF